MPRRSPISASAHAGALDLPRRQARARIVRRHEQTADDHSADVRALLAEPVG